MRTAKKSSAKISVDLATNHPLVAEKVAFVLQGDREIDFRWSGRAYVPSTGSSQASGHVLLIDLLASQQPLESSLPNMTSPLPGCRLLLLCPEVSDERMLAILQLGLKGIVAYDRIDEDLAPAAHVVHQGGLWIPRRILARLIDMVAGRAQANVPSFRLTDQESRVLELLLRALSNKEIATALRVSVRTAKFHVSNILSKYGVQSRNELILQCLNLPKPAAQTNLSTAKPRNHS